MTIIRSIAAGLILSTTVLSVASAETFRGRFDVDAYDDTTIDIDVCAPYATLKVEGDGDTDLDFYLYDPRGNKIFADEDLVDWTMVNINHGSNKCQTYAIDIVNFGDVYNRFTITLTEL